MIMTNWKTTLGGSVSTLGTALMGVGVLPQLKNGPDDLLMKVAFLGFVLKALGSALAHLFAADSKSVSEAIQASDERTDAKIEQATK